MRRILITVGTTAVPAELNQGLTATAIFEALPIEATAHRWGQEIYFEIPVAAELEAGARAEVEVGELGYWPVGRAFCIFFGPTPASTDSRPRAYSPVTIVGRLLADPSPLRAVKEGSRIRLAAAGRESAL
jgi:hypothetical protein